MNQNQINEIYNLVRQKIKEKTFENTTYWDHYRLVKSLNFGHRPTKTETDEVLFFGLSLLQNPKDWRKGAQELGEKALKFSI